MSTPTPIVGIADHVPVAQPRRPAAVAAIVGASAVAIGVALFGVGATVANGAPSGGSGWEGVGQMALGVLAVAVGILTATVAAICAAVGDRRRGLTPPRWATIVSVGGFVLHLAPSVLQVGGPASVVQLVVVFGGVALAAHIWAGRSHSSGRTRIARIDLPSRTGRRRSPRCAPDARRS